MITSIPSSSIRVEGSILLGITDPSTPSDALSQPASPSQGGSGWNPIHPKKNLPII